jgi:hypothetical protein
MYMQRLPDYGAILSHSRFQGLAVMVVVSFLKPSNVFVAQSSIYV